MELVHPANVLVSDLTGQLDFVAEAVNGFIVDGDIRVKNLESDFFADLLVLGPVDDDHPARAQLLDQLEPACEKFPLA